MRRIFGMLVFVLTLMAMAYVAGKPQDAQAEVTGPVVSAPVVAGDSVRFVVTFTAPANVDSVTIQWKLGTTTFHHTLTAPIPTADTARFGGIFPGYSAVGSVKLWTWKDGLSSNGVTRSYNVIIPAPTPPDDVSGVALPDSAVQY